MKFQRNQWFCGIAAVANALECLGIKRTQPEVAKHCHVTPSEGTSEIEIQRALLAHKVKVDPALYKTGFEAIAWLTRQLAMRGPAILCVDSEEHWVTAIGMCGFNWVIFDPARNAGIRIYTQKGLLTRWWAKGYYGIGTSL